MIDPMVSIYHILKAVVKLQNADEEQLLPHAQELSEIESDLTNLANEIGE